MSDKPVRMTAAGKWRAAPDLYAYQDGTPAPGKTWSGEQSTNASGIATFALPAGYFTTVHVAHATPLRNTAAPGSFCFGFVVSRSATSVVVQVAESKQTGVLVGGVIEGLEASPAGIAVMLTVHGL